MSESQNQREIDRYWMAETLALARKGAGRTSPNPMVGALVVKGNEVVGRGYHQRAGGPHAEIIALKEAAGHAAGATLYINLEPCTHYGKTPPCVEAIIQAGIATVVCGMEDPNPKINGGGVKALREHGIGVRVNVLQKESLELNEAHAKFVLTGKPLVTLKIAQSLDGKIATVNGRGERLTGPAAQKFVHSLRAQVDAVLVGKNTVIVDNPQLTVRAVKGRDPLRLILDSWGKIAPSAGVFTNNHDRRTVRIGLSIGKRPLTSPHPDCFNWYVNPDDRHQIDLHEVLETAARNNITSILVEGGGMVFGSFIREQLADKVHILMSPRFIGTGVNALGNYRAHSVLDSVRLTNATVQWLGHDLLMTAYPDYEAEAVDEEEAAEVEQEPEAPPVELTNPVSISGEDEKTDWN